jgi:hypothetical protein
MTEANQCVALDIGEIHDEDYNIALPCRDSEKDCNA